MSWVALYAESLHLRVQCLARDAEAAGGGALRGFLLQPLADQGELDAGEDARERLLRHGVDVADVRRQVASCDAASGRDAEDQAMDLVLELAHVSRPAICLQRAEGVGLEPVDRAALAGGEAGEERLRQRRHLRRTVAERRDADRKHGESVV